MHWLQLATTLTLVTTLGCGSSETTHHSGEPGTSQKQHQPNVERQPSAQKEPPSVSGPALNVKAYKPDTICQIEEPNGLTRAVLLETLACGREHLKSIHARILSSASYGGEGSSTARAADYITSAIEISESVEELFQTEPTVTPMHVNMKVASIKGTLALAGLALSHDLGNAPIFENVKKNSALYDILLARLQTMTSI